MALTNLAARVLRQAACYAPIRNVSTVGKHYAQVRRVEAAQKAADKAARLAELASKQTVAVSEVREEVKLAQLRTTLVSGCDSKSTKKTAAGLKQAAESTVEFAPRELSQMLTLAAPHGELAYKPALAIFNKFIEMDLVPERGAFRCLIRTLEKGKQWKAANVISAFLKDVYPISTFDDQGIPIVASVLQQPIPNILALIDISAEENTFDELTKYMNFRRSHGRPPLFDTLHYNIGQLLQRKEYDNAAAELFAVFQRIGACASAEVPAPFAPIEFHHKFTGITDHYIMDIPLYYNVLEALEARGNFSAAMQGLIYMRSLNRHIDLTPYREITSNNVTRDFIDLHTFDPKQCNFIVKHWMKELRIRRGYVAAFKSQTAGTADAKTYVKQAISNIQYSPLISTEPENLVILADRSYKNGDVRTEQNGVALADSIVETFKAYNIQTIIASVSEFSSSEAAVAGLKEVDPNAPARELTVIVPASELLKYGDEAAAALKAQFV